MTNEIRTQCCICYDWKGDNGYYTPTAIERRVYHFQDGKLSHGYCRSCKRTELIRDGFDVNELEQILKEMEL